MVGFLDFVCVLLCSFVVAGLVLAEGGFRWESLVACFGLRVGIRMVWCCALCGLFDFVFGW